MYWPTPSYSRAQVNRAGDILRNADPTPDELIWAREVLGNWRSCHGYPINTFQATLRAKLRALEFRNSLVAQRLKRTPSIVAKLRRFPGMELARMQDIGGLRAVVGDLDAVRRLERNYQKSIFQHELVGQVDYIENPKESGYRSVHLVYRYRNSRAPAYDGLRVELQLRSRHQHTWATSVETMGTFLGQALKSSEGEAEWLDFFSLAGAAFAHLEGTPPVPGYSELSKLEAYKAADAEATRLRIREQLSAFTVAMDAISSDHRPGSYRLLVLDLDKRQVSIATFTREALEQASAEYLAQEEQIMAGANRQAVLVATGPLDDLRRAYPNYFLDTRDFIATLNRMAGAVKRGA